MQLNSSRPFAGIFATLVFLYLIYTLLATDPLERMNRICAPFFEWPKKAIVAATDLWWPRQSAPLSAQFDEAFNGCRRWVWGVFYEKEYERLLKGEKEK